jgi:branched-chain amino acid transport system substrate-binding protein
MSAWTIRSIVWLVVLSLSLAACGPAATPTPPPAPAQPAAAVTPAVAATPAATPAVATTPATAAATPAATPATPAVTPVATPAAGTAGALRIGILVPFTGDLSNFGPAFFNAAELAVDEINQGGGVLGQPVQLVRADTATSPQQGVQEARRLVDIERVSAIVGAAASGVSLQVAESVTGPGQVLQISPSSTSPALTVARDNDFLFRTTISDAAQGNILGDLARERGFNSACTMFVNNAYGQGLSEQFAQHFQELGGTVTAQVPHEQEQPSYTSELQRCAQGNPDVLVAISYPESAGVYLREAVERQLVQNFLFVDGTQSQDMFDRIGAQAFEGMYGTAPGALDTAVGQAFDEAYGRKYGERPSLPFLRETYDAVYAISLAAQSARSTNSPVIRDAMRTVTNSPGETIHPGPDGWRAAVAALQAGREINYDGAANSTDFDENGDVQRGAIEIWQIENGQISTVETREVDLAQ